MQTTNNTKLTNLSCIKYDICNFITICIGETNMKILAMALQCPEIQYNRQRAGVRAQTRLTYVILIHLELL